MGIWYQNDRGEFLYSDKAEIKFYQECIQELLLWKYESSFYYDRGVDYRGILNKQVFLNIEFETVIDRYKPYFSDISIDYNYREKNTYLDVQIVFTFNDGAIKEYILNLEL